ncbi:hypothetical protein BDZ97DRAFT_1825639 [Flammula alnicola]|nr:hypothetical protein BDZ97DRAFT_1825639 [Flammula alnicola]
MAENRRPSGMSLMAVDSHFNFDNLNNSSNNSNNSNTTNNNHNTNSNNTNKNKDAVSKRIDFTSLPRGTSANPLPMATRPSNVNVFPASPLQPVVVPPPEETLRRNANSRLSTGSVQFTPSLLADDASPGPAHGQGTTKRKRATAQQGRATATTTTTTEDTDAPMVIDYEHDQDRGPIETPQAIEATPNPKPRKLGRHARMPSVGSPTKGRSPRPRPSNTDTTPSGYTDAMMDTTPGVLVQSPYATNPDADWIPPVPALALSSAAAGGSRRSATPIPPYEPPTDVFTPPREVFMSPPTVTPATTKKALRVVTTQVKQEIPDDIDLSAPMPPPSPGPPEPPLDYYSSPRRSVSVQAERDVRADKDGDPALDSEDVEAAEGMMRMDPRDAEVSPVRLFELDDLPGVDTGGWSDRKAAAAGVDEEGVEEGEGEYTGRTKLDPPSSATRERMEEWGRPISPFPKIKKLDLLGEEEEEQDDAPPAVDNEEEDEEEREVRQMSVEFDDEELNIAQFSKEQASVERQPSPAPTVVDRRSSNVFAFPSLETPSPEAGFALNTVDEDVQIHDVSSERQDLLDNDEDDDSSEGDFEPGLVKITSADPRAAARAAAILKQHDYECYTKMILKRRHSEAKQRRASHSGVDDLARESRRRDLASSAVAKSSHKNRRKSTLGMGVMGDRVFIPGTPVMTLPQLLHEAEIEVERLHEHEHERLTPGRVWSARAKFEGLGQRDPFKTPLPDRIRSLSAPRGEVRGGALSPLPLQYGGGDRLWTKEEWKQLDACFTDQRLDLGATLQGAVEDTLAPVDMVVIEDVVDRFVAFVGGQEVIEKYGEAWSRDSLLERTRALQRKQRSGNVARPSTPRPRTPFSFSSNNNTSTSTAPSATDAVLQQQQHRPPSSDMDVPDFTPLTMHRRALPHPRKSRLAPVLPPPVVHRAPFADLLTQEEEEEGERKARRMMRRGIPKTLLAPRYSHLLEEAVAVGLEGEYRVAVPSREKGEEKEKEKERRGDESFSSTSAESAGEAGLGDERLGGDGDGEEGMDDGEECANDTTTTTTTPAARPRSDPNPPPTATTTIGTRVKGFLYSYLPSRLAKSSSSKPSSSSSSSSLRKGLPLPPASILAKPRGPVTTPARAPLPRPKHPKELVSLHPAPPPSSGIPRATTARGAPRRMVNLNKIPMPVEQPVVVVSRPRRSSGSSVRDLVRGFEEMREGRVRSGGGEVRRAWRAGAGDTRPKWKP